MTRVLVVDPTLDTGKCHNESPELETSKPTKATFQWPPGCLWPFIEQPKRDKES